MPAYPRAPRPFWPPRTRNAAKRCCGDVYERRRGSRGRSTPRRARGRAARSVESDIPTTVDGSPSTRSMNAPPRLSIVKAPATCSGSPDGDVRVDLGIRHVAAKVTDASATACASRGSRAGREADDRVPGVQHAGAPAHRLPPRGRVLGGVRLAEHLAVELEHRVAADHDAVEVGDRRRRARAATSAALRRASSSTCSSRREGAPLGCLDRRDDGLLVDVGSDGQRAGCRTAAAA